MDAVLISRSAEQRDLDSVPDRVRLEFAKGGNRLALTLDLFHFGCDLREREFHYLHPAPPFCRLFHFAGEVSPGAEILCGGNVFRPDTGSIWLLNAGHPFEVRYFAGSKLCYAHLRLTDQTRRPVFLDSPGMMELRDPLLNALLESAWAECGRAAVLSAAAAVMCRFAGPLFDRLAERAGLFGRFAPMLAAIDAAPPARLRVAELAERMNLTPFALSKSFRRKTGIPLKTYLDSLYFDRARELLVCSGGTVEDIAALLGHSDVHYFYHRFRRLAGCSPGEYRAERTDPGAENGKCPEIALN